MPQNVAATDHHPAPSDSLCSHVQMIYMLPKFFTDSLPLGHCWKSMILYNTCPRSDEASGCYPGGTALRIQFLSTCGSVKLKKKKINFLTHPINVSERSKG